MSLGRLSFSHIAMLAERFLEEITEQWDESEIPAISSEAMQALDISTTRSLAAGWTPAPRARDVRKYGAANAAARRKSRRLIVPNAPAISAANAADGWKNGKAEEWMDADWATNRRI